MPKDSIFDFGDKFSINSPFDDWTKDRPRILRQSNLLTREGAERKTGESNIYAHVTNLKEESINNYYIETEYEGTPLLVNHSVKIDKKGEKIYFRINLYFVEEGNWAGDKYYEFRPSVPFFFKLGYSYSFTSKLFLRGTSKPLNKMKGGFPINEEAKDPRYGLNKPTSLSHEYKGYFG
ncbi:MAG: hypothetical protein ACPG5P_03980, partial [Saprospiraceae bacterium]